MDGFTSREVKQVYSAPRIGCVMEDEQTSADVEMLARMAARFAGRDPEEHVEIRISDSVVFSGPAWRYPDFLGRAEAAYQLLHRGFGW